MSYKFASESQDDELRPLVGAKYIAVGSADDRNMSRSYGNSKRENNKEKIMSIRNISIFSVVAIVFITYTLSSKSKDGTDKSLTTLVSTASTTKPNFVFVLVDDVGWNSLGYQNYDLTFATPYMTELAQNGVILSNYYSQEICTPARASLMTGRYPVTVGVMYGAIQPAEKFALNIEETLLPEVLKEHGGYTNYVLGKWNLGHYNPKYLPTARGFDYFLGFMDGHNYYWSKRDPQADNYVDFMYSDTECYNVYNGTDVNTYSTFLYEQKITNIIATHDYESSPMFLYYAAQAAHDPFSDYDSTYPDGIPEEYVNSTRYAEVMEGVEGGKRQQYTLSLMLLDDSINAITTALTEAGQLDNTYIIVASDNGGCYSGGGKNGPLRGSKGSLYEGGTKVDSFIYSPLLSSSAGSTYSGIMHVSDWFPTILSYAGITTYEPSGPHTLDGFDQSAAIAGSKTDTSNELNPRDYLLYGLYANVTTEDFDVYTNAPVGIRNSQYKLLHAFVGNPSAKWYPVESSVGNDDDISGYTSCSQAFSISGTYTKFLFDLVNDPYETTNLYGVEEYADVQAELYEKIGYYVDRTHNQDSPKTAVAAGAYSYWEERNYFVQPWIFDTGDSTSPSLCDSSHVLSPDGEMKGVTPNPDTPIDATVVNPGGSDPGRDASKSGSSTDSVIVPSSPIATNAKDSTTAGATTPNTAPQSASESHLPATSTAATISTTAQVAAPSAAPTKEVDMLTLSPKEMSHFTKELRDEQKAGPAAQEKHPGGDKGKSKA